MVEIIYPELQIMNFTLLVVGKGYIEEFNSSNCNTKKQIEY